MGLDMYLTRKKYVKNWEHTPENQKHDIKISRNGRSIDSSRVMTIEFEEIYWRKANQIHEWFVKNIQNGNDNCAEYYVSSEQLTNLLDDILYSLKNKDHTESVLPTSKGFFFGSDEYDQDYWHDLQITADELEEILSNSEALEDDFSYRASW